MKSASASHPFPFPNPPPLSHRQSFFSRAHSPRQEWRPVVAGSCISSSCDRSYHPIHRPAAPLHTLVFSGRAAGFSAASHCVALPSPRAGAFFDDTTACCTIFFPLLHACQSDETRIRTRLSRDFTRPWDDNYLSAPFLYDDPRRLRFSRMTLQFLLSASRHSRYGGFSSGSASLD